MKKKAQSSSEGSANVKRPPYPDQTRCKCNQNGENTQPEWTWEFGKTWTCLGCGVTIRSNDKKTPRMPMSPAPTLRAVGSDPAEWEGTYITFFLSGDYPQKRKTFVWHVAAKNGSMLGEVRWFARWRKYGFFPSPNCVFEQVCLREIAEFLEWATHTHKHGV